MRGGLLQSKVCWPNSEEQVPVVEFSMIRDSLWLRSFFRCHQQKTCASSASIGLATFENQGAHQSSSRDSSRATTSAFSLDTSVCS